MANEISISEQLGEIFDEYTKEVRRATSNAQDKVAKEAVRKLRTTSPKRSGKYAKGWSIKRTWTGTGIPDVTIHNKVYQLTHLLEKGHVVRNKSGTYGRAKAIPHIAPVERWAIEELPEEIKRELMK